ncbi:MAG: prefoldin subunit [Nanoarchaeota archaeon]
MEFDNETNKRIEELRTLESYLQNFLAQKQSFQIELNEIDNAISELKKHNDDVYKIISGIMIKSKREDIAKELGARKEIAEMKVKSIEKQEELIGNKASELRREINNSITEGQIRGESKKKNTLK